MCLAPLALSLTACDGNDRPASSEPVLTDSATIASTAASDLDRRTMGPLVFSFDPDVLRAFDVEATFPPDYEATYGGLKLIPVDRAALIGQRECSYGQSGLMQICEAAAEVGIAFAILPRPAAYYRDKLIESGIPTDEIEDATIAGVEGFRFTAQAEGSGVANTFLPAGRQTILVERTFRDGEGQGADAFGRMLSSVEVLTANGTEASRQPD